MTNFGTLGLPDSVIAFVRRATAQGATRASVIPGVDALVTTMLRHATLCGTPDGWDKPLAAAFRVDSALAAPSSRFLVAAMITYAATSRIEEIATAVGPPLLASAADAAPRDRSAGCLRIAPIESQLTVADNRLRDGGDRYTGANVAAFRAGLAAARNKLTSLKEACAKP